MILKASFTSNSYSRESELYKQFIRKGEDEINTFMGRIWARLLELIIDFMSEGVYFQGRKSARVIYLKNL